MNPDNLGKQWSAKWTRKTAACAFVFMLAALLAYPVWRTFAAGGDLDTSFSSNGQWGDNWSASTNIREIRIQVDPNNPTVEKLIVPYAISDDGPYLGSENYASFRVKRLHPSGALDTSFGNNGVALISFNSLGLAPGMSTVTAIELQADGKILVAGNLMGNGTTVIGVARLTFNGALDATFGTGGRWFYFGNSNVSDMTVQPSDGKIVLAGRAKPTLNGAWKSAVWRLNTNGTLNNSFGSTGYADLTVRPGDNLDGGGFRSVAVQPDGKIVALNSPGGFLPEQANNSYRLRRFTASGAFDSAWSVNSIAGERGFTIKAAASSIRVIGAKEQQGEKYGAIFTHNTTNGFPDPSFGNAGKVLSPQPSVWTDMASVPFSIPAKFVVAGWNRHESVAYPYISYKGVITRYLGTGALDTSFGTNGSSETAGEDSYAYPNIQYFSVRIGLSGKIVAAGRSLETITFLQYVFIARYWGN